MSIFIGRKIEVGVGIETTRGTKVNPTYWLPKYDVNIQNKSEYLNDEQSLGNIADSDDARIVGEISEGSISGKARDKSIGVILASVLGMPTTTTVEAGVYKHVFKMQNDNTNPSLTVEVKNPNEQLAYVLAMVNSLTLSAEVGGYVEFEGALTAKKGVTSSNTPAYIQEHEFISKDVSLKIDTTSVPSVKSITTAIEKNVEAIPVMGSNAPQDIGNKQMSVEQNIEAYFDTTTIKGMYEGGQTHNIEVTIKDADTTIGASNNPTIKITLPTATIQEFDIAGGNDDFVAQSFKIKGHYDQSTSKMIEVELINEVSSY